MSLTSLLAIVKYTSRPKSAAVKDIDIDIVNILGQQYRYRINISHGNIDPPLICGALTVRTCWLWLVMSEMISNGLFWAIWFEQYEKLLNFWEYLIGINKSSATAYEANSDIDTG